MASGRRSRSRVGGRSGIRRPRAGHADVVGPVDGWRCPRDSSGPASEAPTAILATDVPAAAGSSACVGGYVDRGHRPVDRPVGGGDRHRGDRRRTSRRSGHLGVEPGTSRRVGVARDIVDLSVRGADRGRGVRRRAPGHGAVAPPVVFARATSTAPPSSPHGRVGRQDSARTPASETTRRPTPPPPRDAAPACRPLALPAGAMPRGVRVSRERASTEDSLPAAEGGLSYPMGRRADCGGFESPMAIAGRGHRRDSSQCRPLGAAGPRPARRRR